MAIYTDGVVPWNSLDNNTRVPLSSELESGYPCGEADQQLFNWTAGWPIGNIWNMILQSGITPDTDKLLDLARAVQAGKVNYAVAGGTANALTATLSPVPATLSAGLCVRLKIASINTGPMTLNLNGLGVKSVKGQDGSALSAGAVFPDDMATFMYNGVDWLLAGYTTSRMPPKNIQVFNTAGTTNFVVPAGVYSLFVEVYGGGGGAAVQNFGTGTVHGEGGGGGGYSESWLQVVPGQTIAVTVGAAGTNSGTGSNGTAGGSSSFGASLSATGGGGATTAGSPGAGGSGTGGQINLNGGTGYDGNDVNIAVWGAGGDAAGPHGGKGGRSTGGNATWPGGGGGIVVAAGSTLGAPPSVGGVIVRW